MLDTLRMPTAFNTLYMEFRNRLRAYRTSSIVEAAMHTLRHDFGDALENLRMAPWQVMLVVKWALQDKMGSDVGTIDVSSTQFDQLRQQLHEFPERMAGGAIESLSLFMRRHLHQQVAFQRQMSIGFAREAALLGTLPDNHALRQGFLERTGLTSEKYLDFALATYSAVVDQGRLDLSFNWFQALRRSFGEDDFRSYVALVSRDYHELRQFCRTLPTKIPRVASEYFEFTPLSRFPFLRRADSLNCWHRMIFFRGMEGLVHSVLSEAGEAYIQPFSKLFEQHIVAELLTTGCEILDENQLRHLFGNDSQVPDALLSFPEANVFVEAKAGLFDESVMTVGNAEILSHKTKALRNAIMQGWAASTAIRSTGAAPAQARQAPFDYLLVVTNRELAASRGTLLAEMYPEGKLTYPNADVEHTLPLSRIYVLSVDDFERVVAAINSDHLSLPDLLAACVARDARPETAKFYFEQHLAAHTVRNGRSKVLNDALDRSAERLNATLAQ